VPSVRPPPASATTFAAAPPAYPMGALATTDLAPLAAPRVMLQVAAILGTAVVAAAVWADVVPAATNVTVLTMGVLRSPLYLSLPSKPPIASLRFPRRASGSCVRRSAGPSAKSRRVPRTSPQRRLRSRYL
jgi:hypothetical protein